MPDDSIPQTKNLDEGTNFDLSLFPNPVSSGELHLSYMLSSPAEIDIQLFDLYGRPLIFSRYTSTEHMTSSMIRIPTFFFLFFAISLHAQTNFPKPDSTFNGIGHLLVEDYVYFEPKQLAIQADGKILAGGSGNKNDVFGILDGLLARINPDGSLDTGFDFDGIKELDVDGAEDKVSGIHLLPDGKILVLLESTYRSFLIRLNADGSYDTGFGDEGFLYIPTKNFEVASALLIQEDQKVLILSDYNITNKSIVTVRRCNIDGTLDASYGDNGRVIIDSMPQNFYAPFGALQSDGKLVLSGGYGYQATSGFLVIRLNTDGSFDSSFSDDGIYLNIMGTTAYSAYAQSMALHSDGTIFVGGASPTASNVSPTVLSLTSTGSATPGFGLGGVARISFGSNALARSLCLQPDGKILLSGYKFADQTTTHFMLARLNTNGTADATFGTQGKVLLSPFAPNYKLEIFAKSALTPNGKLVGLGWVQETLNVIDNSKTHFSVHRFLTGITVKAEEPSAVFQESRAIPNVLGDRTTFTLEYTLKEAGNINSGLYDEAGNWIKTLVPNTTHSAGKQSEACTLPLDLPAGLYYVVLDNGLQVKPVRVVLGHF